MTLQRSLARGWYQGNKRWWHLSAATLAFTLTGFMLAAGLFAGMQAETESRVGDFYVDEFRVATSRGIIPSDVLPPNYVAQHPEATKQLESQLVISRRGFVDQAINEDTEFGIDTGSGSRDLAIGIVLGTEADSPISSYLVAGRMPTYTNGTMELVMSYSRYLDFLSDAELARLSDPPRVNELRLTTFSVTAARLEGGSLVDGGQLIVDTARVVGLYDTGVDVLDDFTYVATLEDVRQLQGFPANASRVNVLRFHADPGSPYPTESVHEFNDRYLGQMIGAIEWVSSASSIMLFLLPAFLLTNGLIRQLQTQQREIAVLHAIGIPDAAIRGAVIRLLMRMSLMAAAATVVVVTGVGITLWAILPGLDVAPVPLSFTVTLAMLVQSGIVLLVTVALSGAIALRQARMQNVAAQMRV